MKKIFALAIAIGATPALAVEEKPFDIYRDLSSHVTQQACTNSELALMATLAMAVREVAESDLGARRATLTLDAVSALVNPAIVTTWASPIPSAKLIEDAYLADRLQYETTCRMTFIDHALNAIKDRHLEEVEKLETAKALIERMNSMTGG